MSQDDSTVLFQRVPAGLPRAEIRAFAAQLQDTVTGGRFFTCLLTNDDELRRLNREFLGKDYPTDVLSFPGSTQEGTVHLGELAISVPRAQEQSSEFGHSVGDEIKILMLHGVLHLMGLDHEKKDRGAMAKAEKNWRKDLGLPVGLIERTRK